MSGKATVALVRLTDSTSGVTVTVTSSAAVKLKNISPIAKATTPAEIIFGIDS